MPNVSEHLKRIFREHNVEAHFKSGQTIRQFMGTPKGRTPKENLCGVVYHIQCKDCDNTYIGETGRQLKTRVKEHRKPSSSGYDSAVYEHSTTQGHRINWDNIKILGTEDRDLARKVKEAIHIRRHNPQMNRDRGYNLPPVFQFPS